MQTFRIVLDSGLEYEVKADHEIHHANGAVGCSVSVYSIRPITRVDIAITDQLLEEIESALAYKIIDEYNDGDTEEEFQGYPC